MKIPYKTLAFLIFPLMLMNTQCDDDDMAIPTCDQTAIIDPMFYQSAESADFNLGNFSFNGSCFTVEISASGCSGETWSIVLVDSGAVAESSPEQRHLKFVFTNDEACAAFIDQTRSFDLTPLQVEGSNEVVLNIEGIPEAIHYIY